MDNLEKIVAEQLAGEDYKITEWHTNPDGNSYRDLEIKIGSFILGYQQTMGKDSFYSGRLFTLTPFFAGVERVIAIDIGSYSDEIKRDVAFVRSILPELEVMLSKVQAYRELAR